MSCFGDLKCCWCQDFRQPSRFRAISGGVPSVKNDDPALVRWTFSNTTSEPLSSRGLCLRLIVDWGERTMRASRRRVMADPGRDWYSWLLPALCLILLAGLLLKP